MLPEIKDQGKHFTNFGWKIFSDDLDASHYLYIITTATITTLNSEQ